MKLATVPVGSLSLASFDGVVPPGVATAVHLAERLARHDLAGRRIWNVNSTARGGGVAEMLVTLLAYARGAGVDARWVVVTGNSPFFAVTKRLHNRLHGIPGDGGPLGDAERKVYENALAPNGSDLCDLISRNDIVILHDPQTAGLIPQVKARGVPVILISHNLPHVFEVADRIQVMRLGRRIGIARPGQNTMDDVVAMMTGASQAEMRPATTPG